MIKEGINVVSKRSLCYIAKGTGGVRRFKPWLGDSFSFFYDSIMRRSIFPKKFGADIGRHYEILGRELGDVHGRSVLELATGSGSAVHFLANDNQYTGTDISAGLLRRAVINFRAAGFNNAEFYVSGVEELPFQDGVFSVCLCILSLNFFGDINKVILEIARVMSPGGLFVCSVPVPERNQLHATIRGKLYSEDELAVRFGEHGFTFQSISQRNGALLYFRASTPAVSR